MFQTFQFSIRSHRMYASKIIPAVLDHKFDWVHGCVVGDGYSFVLHASIPLRQLLTLSNFNKRIAGGLFAAFYYDFTGCKMY